MSAGTVAYLARDLFFGTRLADGLRRMGLTAAAVGPQHDAPLADLRLLIVDLSAPRERWEPLIQAAHQAGVPVLGFGSHMDQERWRQARAAGATRLVANSQLVQRLPELVEGLMDQAGRDAEEDEATEE